LVSARALGGSAIGNFRRHYYPDLLDHVRLKFPSLFAQAILLEATLSFLNLGVQPGVVSWGALLAHAKDYLVEAPHIAWFVGFPLALTLLALQAWIDDATQVKQRLKPL
jgi:peptide/nickel transport system permease protein